MIEIKITDQSIHMNGHAGRKGPDGIDRACAAVSALTCNLANSLEDLAGEKISADLECGMAVIEWEELSCKGKLLVDSWYLGMTEINREYNCIQFQ
ncbi:ribosomal-processing cysteine protease Prp [Dorea sp. OM07-5]|uniref:ribosomal-processing cysteine protease Prp n=1 Tax=Dorea sp. OM07-5 TaxID=2293100 RepID=UPI000E4BC6D2|nr:ribosomal-processing cysteine protease Prp [Dorea sp. OM07-5]RHU94301.1 ribosomal-processing cysteine protease Prp [Dorea sp. OM07-5]